MGQHQTTRDNLILDNDIRSPKEMIRLKIPLSKSKREKIKNIVHREGATVIKNKNNYIIWSPLDKSEKICGGLLVLNVEFIGTVIGGSV
jgi:phosphopantothenate synthetase